MEGSVNNYQLKNKNKTIFNGKNDLAPIKKPSEAEEGFTTEMVIIGAFITLLILSIIVLVYSSYIISRYQYCHQEDRKLTRSYADDYGAYGDVCVEINDQARTIGEWCPNIGEETQQEILDVIEYKYETAYQIYIDNDNDYWARADPNYMNTHGARISETNYLSADEYHNVQGWQYWSFIIGGSSIIGLTGMFLRRYIH